MAHRISGRPGETIDLNFDFYRGGVLADPHAIRRIDIYKTAVRDDNLVAQVIVVDPTDPTYPAPVDQVLSGSGDIVVGRYTMPFIVPDDFDAPAAYFDVWRFVCDDLGTGGDLDDETLWLSKCGRFWLQTTGGWHGDDGLETPDVAFEPLDVFFNQPENKPLQVGVMPMPLYDFNWNLVVPQILGATATITIRTKNCEFIVQDAPMTIGLRSGSYRSNPFVLKYPIDSDSFLIGTYEYRVTLTFPNGISHSSRWFTLTIA